VQVRHPLHVLFFGSDDGVGFVVWRQRHCKPVCARQKTVKGAAV
jgi:hypothetical protein